MSMLQPTSGGDIISLSDTATGLSRSEDTVIVMGNRDPLLVHGEGLLLYGDTLLVSGDALRERGDALRERRDALWDRGDGQRVRGDRKQQRRDTLLWDVHEVS